jgi:hypothetical protein
MDVSRFPDDVTFNDLQPLMLCTVYDQRGADVAVMAASWLIGSRPFDDPIPLPRGRQLATLKDAANYIQKLPKAEQLLDEWQAAVEALLLVIELNGPTMMARIGVMRALNRHVERVFNTDRKDKHWGKRKIKRGE